MESAAIEFFATFLIWILYAGLVVLWFIDGKIRKEQVIHALFAGLMAWVIAFLIKGFFPTLRPFLVNGEEALVLITPARHFLRHTQRWLLVLPLPFLCMTEKSGGGI